MTAEPNSAPANISANLSADQRAKDTGNIDIGTTDTGTTDTGTTDTGATETGTRGTGTDATAASDQSPTDLEHRYYQYLRGHDYSSTGALVAVLRDYLPHFANHERVLDIGCGHGEFLQLLQEAGHDAMGVDIDPAMVAACQAEGLTAIEADAISWLATQDQQFDAIFSSNVIEHLTVEQVQQLSRHAYRALRPGGMLLLGTPNPESVIVQLHEFWRDPTHVRLYDRQLVEFFLADAGFTNIQNGNNAAASWEGFAHMLDPAHHAAVAVVKMADLPPAPVPNTPAATLHPLPEPPGAQVPWRQRLAFRLLHLFYQKFLEPYIALLRHDLAQQQQQSVDLYNYVQAQQEQIQQLQQHNHQLTQSLQSVIAQQEARFEQVGESLHFLNPPREYFVCGYKAAAPAAEAVATPTAK